MKKLSVRSDDARKRAFVFVNYRGRRCGTRGINKCHGDGAVGWSSEGARGNKLRRCTFRKDGVGRRPVFLESYPYARCNNEGFESIIGLNRKTFVFQEGVHVDAGRRCGRGGKRWGMYAWRWRRSHGRHHIRIANINSIASHGSNDGMAAGILADCAESELSILGGRVLRAVGHGGLAAKMWGLGYPARSEGKAVAIYTQKFVAAVWSPYNLPRLPVGHEKLGFGYDGFVFLARTDDAHDFPRAKTLLVGFFFFIGVVFFGFQDEQVGGGERLATEGSDLAAGREREEDGVGNDFVGRLRTARGNYLVELQDDFGADV